MMFALWYWLFDLCCLVSGFVGLLGLIVEGSICLLSLVLLRLLVLAYYFVVCYYFGYLDS